MLFLEQASKEQRGSIGIVLLFPLPRRFNNNVPRIVFQERSVCFYQIAPSLLKFWYTAEVKLRKLNQRTIHYEGNDIPSEM
jgi:hypothetical protein